MRIVVPDASLNWLAGVLCEPARSARHLPYERVARSLDERGWLFSYQVEDLLFDLDERLYDGDGKVDTYLEWFGLRWDMITSRPRSRARSAILSNALPAAAVVALLSGLERCGFATDPTPLVSHLLPGVRAKAYLTREELHVLWFDREHHKMEPVFFETSDNPLLHRTRIERWRAESGYRFECWRDNADACTRLGVHAPKYRRRPEPTPVRCDVCHMLYCRGDPAESAAHRREHAKWMRIWEPKPHPKVLRSLESREAELELVICASPVWKHREMYARALAFKREFGYDFAQWAALGKDDDPTVHGYLFTDSAGRITGACAFRWREWSNAPAQWALQWIWIAPPHRRSGCLSQRWDAFRARFGDFLVEPPVSQAMQAFLAKHDDLGLMPGERSINENASMHST